MARLLDSVEGNVTVEYRQYYVVGLRADGPLPDYIMVPREIDQEHGPGPEFGWTVHSGANDHKAAVRAERWDSAPPAPTDWPYVVEFTATTTATELQINRLTRSPEDLEMPLPAGRYGVRLLCRGRDEIEDAVEAAFEAAEAAEEAGEEPEGFGFPVGVEQYLFQLWPL